MSQLNSMQIAAMNRLGNIICPRNGEFASFSDLDVVAHADIVLNELPESDLKDLKLLLIVMWFLPTPLMHVFLVVLEKMKNLGGELGSLIRMMNFGLRGLTFALYYSGLKGPRAISQKSPVDVIGFAVQVQK